MAEMQFVSKSLADLEAAAQQIIKYSGNCKCLVFYGEMGVGKTTLIKRICKELDVLDRVSSPTYSLVNEYVTATGEAVYHFDFYRIKSEEEAMDIGIEEYFYSGDYCLIEWPDKISSLLPNKRIEVYLSIEKEERIINLKST